MLFRLCVSVCLVFGFCPLLVFAQVKNDTVLSGERQAIELLVPAPDGVVLWSDVASSLADSLKLDARSVQQMLPAGQMNLRSETVLLVLMGINLAAGDSLSFAIVRDAQNQPALRVKCDRRLFGSTGKKPETTRETEIHLDDDWQQRLKKPLLVCIHGLRSHAEAFASFRAHFRQAGFATMAVTYDYDQPIQESARQLAVAVEQLFAKSNVKPRLVLVGHSMGGLVAREWTENPTLHDPNIEHLITVGTPHLGSNWASLPPLLDLFTGGQLDSDDLVDVILHQPSASGLRDLVPESEFIRTLATRPRRKDVTYTNIVGTHSPVDQVTATQLRDVLRELDQEGSVVRLVRPRIAPLLDSFDELADGQGDGVVSVEHTHLAGVPSTPVAASHFQMIRPIPGRQDHPIWKVIQERLGN